MARPLSQQEIVEMYEEHLQHLIVKVPGLSAVYCSEDLDRCSGCEQHVVEPLDDLGLCEHCSYDHATDMEHLHDIMSQYRKDAL